MSRAVEQSESTRVAEFIRWFGLAAIINGDFAPAEVIEISDAMLAAPILVLALASHTHDADENLAALRRRHGHNLVVGASHVADAAALEAMIDAGAQFVLAEQFELHAYRTARRQDVLYVPRCDTAADAALAREHGCTLLLQVLTTETGFAAPLRDVMLVGDLQLENASLWAQAGAAAVCFGYAPVAVPAWTAADLITRARQLRAIWQDAAPPE